MKARYDPEKHHRRSIRLQGYDYSRVGSYFVTICTHNQRWMFGRVVDGKMVLNGLGKVVEQCWREIPVHYPDVVLDEFVVMPNHVHGIITITVDSRTVREPVNGAAAQTGGGTGAKTGGGDAGPAMGGIQNFESLPLPPTRPMPASTDNPAPNGAPPPSPTGAAPNDAPSPYPTDATVPNTIASSHAPAPNGSTPMSPRPQNRYQHIIPRSVGSIVRGFKIGVTKWARQNTGMDTVWQRNFHEIIVRDERALHNMRRYIQNNPAKWQADKFFSAEDERS